MNCPQCGREIELLEGQKFCSFCGATLGKSEAPPDRVIADSDPDQGTGESPLPEPIRGVESGYTPWEDQENQGFLGGLLLTVRQSLFSPGPFFSRIPVTGGFLNPLLYGLVLETLGTMAGYAWGLLLDHPLLSYGQVSGDLAVVIGLMIPFIVVLRLLLWAALLHGSLWLLKGANADFEATFRVVCYSCGPQLCNAVPVIGGVIALCWTLFISVVGVREVHRTSSSRALAAVCLPFFVCCGILVGALGLVALLNGFGG